MIYNLIGGIFNLQSNFFNFDFLFARIVLSFIFSFILSIFGLKYFIKHLNKRSTFQPIRITGPEEHLTTKQKTPTMGGFVLLIAILFSSLLFCNLKDIQVIFVLVILTLFGIIGFVDDYIKIFHQNTDGFKGSIKIVLQILICGIMILLLAKNNPSIINSESVFIPFFKFSLYVGILLIPFLIAVIVGSANAVNITDGLDGLVIVPIIISLFSLGILSVFNGFNNFEYISFINLNNPSELAIICSAGIGSGIAFFIYNKSPAKIFMGDVGSLMYGSLLGSVAVILRQEVFYGIIGLLFVIESTSVIIQVTSHVLFGKRVFKMAPIHHHFEKSGWSEKKVVLTFWLFSFICCVIGIIGIINY